MPVGLNAKVSVPRIRRLTLLPGLLPVAPVTPVLSRISRLVVVLALLASVGGHWAVLQSVAWTQMLVERTSGESFTRALETTFDGAHPCALCKRIADGKQKEQQPERAPVSTKLDLLLERRVIAFIPPFVDAEFFLVAVHAPSRVDCPPVPPPRSA